MWAEARLRRTCAIMILKQTVKNKDEEYRFPNGIGE
jgi:hypothetical protein